MRISWGYKIALLYCSFVALMIVLVVKSMHQKIDLVSKDYYAEELAFQKQIDAGKNQSALSAAIGIHADAQNVVIEFPSEFKNESIQGKVHFYAPANADFDKDIPLATANNICMIPRSLLQHTRYSLKINWEAAGKKYYQETDLNLAQ
ncbi:FixH family protein [Taibaiella soli]|nr:FixH family protein [Taibaiella soli]